MRILPRLSSFVKLYFHFSICFFIQKGASFEAPSLYINYSLFHIIDQAVASFVSAVYHSEASAVIFVTEKLAEQIEDEIERYKDMPMPAIVSVPGRDGSTGYGMENIRNAALRAVGADILFGGNDK